MILIHLNGQPLTLAVSTDIASLISENDFDIHAIAVVLNDAVIPKSKWLKTQCKTGDRVDVFTVVAGG
ncbi:sulfur carrier protein ThiS [Shewanella sp. A25]|nr:sulfur carrier protein ThiS [Shewanella shenzhenensis]